MRAFLLVAAWALVDLGVMTLVLRTFRVRRRAAGLTGIWLATVPGFVTTLLLLPPDLGVVSPALTEPRLAAELAFGLILYAASFFGGILQIYNLADRGFSLRILIDIHEAGRPLRVEEVAAMYGAGQGIGWMFGKRVDGLAQQALVRRDGERLALTPRGRRTAAVLAALQSLLRVS